MTPTLPIAAIVPALLVAGVSLTVLAQSQTGFSSSRAERFFLSHDIGTGDGIPFLPTPEFASTANQIRTAPLWALRTRNRLMHDGLSFTKQEAIMRHGAQAANVTARYAALSEAERALLMAFLDSL